ncbi:MAG: hypothetical protein HY726_14840 [Candidatus Rokubacteria bacterium]|nr:hypothetical protein [Candidatus Rokubacteria bacterium]
MRVVAPRTLDLALRIMLSLAGAAFLLLSGCTGMGQVAGLPGESSPTLSLQPSRWVLITNPRFGDIPGIRREAIPVFHQ